MVAGKVRQNTKVLGNEVDGVVNRGRQVEMMKKKMITFCWLDFLFSLQSHVVPDFFHSRPLPQISVSPLLICPAILKAGQFSLAVHGKYVPERQC